MLHCLILVARSQEFRVRSLASCRVEDRFANQFWRLLPGSGNCAKVNSEDSRAGPIATETGGITSGEAGKIKKDTEAKRD